MLLALGMSSVLEWMQWHVLASIVRSQLAILSVAATIATLQWLIGDINHLQVVTICVEAASIVLGLQADNGDWTVWITELAVTTWLITKSTATRKKQSHSITTWGSGTVGTIMLALLAAIIAQGSMGCWMVMSGWMCRIARLIYQFARAWWLWLELDIKGRDL